MPGVKRKLHSAVEAKTKFEGVKASKDAVERNKVAIEKYCPPGFEKMVTIDQVIEFSRLNHDQFVLCILWFCQMILKVYGVSDFDDMTDQLWRIKDHYECMLMESDGYDSPKKVCQIITGGQTTVKELFDKMHIIRTLTKSKRNVDNEMRELFVTVSFVKFCQFKSAIDQLYLQIIPSLPIVRDLGTVHMLKILKLIPKRIRYLELSEVTILDLVPVLLTLLRMVCISWPGSGIGGDVNVYLQFNDRVLDPFIWAFPLLEKYLCLGQGQLRRAKAANDVKCQPTV